MELSTLGFVSFIPRKGVVINVLETEDIKDLFYYRLALERGVIERIFALGLSDKQKSMIKTKHTELVEASQHGEIEPFIEQDRDFHAYLAALSNNKFFIESLRKVRDLIDWNNKILMARYERIPEVVVEHQNIVDGLIRQDIEATYKALEVHLMTAIRKMEKHIQP